MKLKEFNSENTPKLSGRTMGSPRISFSKGGVINLNGSACTLLEIKPGQKITLAQDEDDTANWYIYKSDKGFEVRGGYDKKGCLLNHATLTKSVISTLELDTDKSHNFLIAGQPTIVKGDKTKYWGLLITAKV